MANCNKMSGKTPVSVLHEMGVRNPPHYELIHDGTGTHESLFKYEVFVGEVSAIGSGRSKKEAKQDAAKNILIKLQESGQMPTPEAASGSEPAIDVDDMLSPYEDVLQENAVGQLQQLCMTNEIPLPEYILVGDEGPPHAKQFTIMCRVSKLEEEAMARTKKQAKQQAAYRMLKRLKSSLSDVLTVNEKVEKNGDHTENPFTKFRDLGVSSTNQKVPIGHLISEYHLMQKSLKSDMLDKLHAGDPTLEQQISDDGLDVLKLLLDELHIKSEFTEMPSRGKCTMLLSLFTTPEAAILGAGDTVEEACQNTAVKAIDYLKVMSK